MFDKDNVTGIDMGNTKGGAWGQAICRYAAFMEFTKIFVPEVGEGAGGRGGEGVLGSSFLIHVFVRVLCTK